MARLPYVVTPSEAARRKRVWLTSPGYYAITLRKGGVEVGALVTHGPTPDPCDPTGNPLERERSWFWEVWANGELERGPSISCDWGPGALFGKMLIGRRIDEDEYAYLLELRAYQRQYAPHEAGARPRDRVDINLLPVPEF